MHEYNFKDITIRKLRRSLHQTGKVRVLIEPDVEISVIQNLNDIEKCFGGIKLTKLRDKLSPYRLLIKMFFGFFTGNKVSVFVGLYLFDQPLFNLKDKYITFYLSNDKNNTNNKII